MILCPKEQPGCVPSDHLICLTLALEHWRHGFDLGKIHGGKGDHLKCAPLPQGPIAIGRPQKIVDVDK